jgi:hypothetical protein
MEITLCGALRSSRLPGRAKQAKIHYASHMGNHRRRYCWLCCKMDIAVPKQPARLRTNDGPRNCRKRRRDFSWSCDPSVWSRSRCWYHRIHCWGSDCAVGLARTGGHPLSAIHYDTNLTPCLVLSPTIGSALISNGRTIRLMKATRLAATSGEHPLRPAS